MGYWFLLFAGLIVGIILYAWVVEEAQGHWIPLAVLGGITLIFVIIMGVIGQWYLVIGTLVGALVGTVFCLHVSPERAKRRKKEREDLVYKRKCWFCGEVFDVHGAKICGKCHSHYRCPHCGKCYCENPNKKGKKNLFMNDVDLIPEKEFDSKDLPTKNR